MTASRMTDWDVERRLGYTPCVCGVIDGSWHARCYAGKTQEQIEAGYKKAFMKARAYLHTQDAARAAIAIDKAAKP